MSDARSVVAVTGLDFEARIAAGPGVRTVTGAGDRDGLAAALGRELARGVTAIISFGISGGLVAEASAGTWLVADAVITRTARWPVDAAWAAELQRQLPGAVRGSVAGADAIIASPAQKRALGLDHRRVRRGHGIAHCRRVRGSAQPALRGVPGGCRSSAADARAGGPRGHALRWNGQPARGIGIAVADAGPAAAADAQRDRHANRAARAVTRSSTPWPGPGLPGFPTASGRRGVRTRTAPGVAVPAESRGPSLHPPWCRDG